MDVGLHEYELTRAQMHRVAAHVLGRRRWQVEGRFGLRITPGGIATPLFGSKGERLRTTGTHLVREIGGRAYYLAMDGASLADLARFAAADLDAEFRCGADTPDLGDPDQPISLGEAATGLMAEWLQWGWTALDGFLTTLPDSAQPETLQLWPEHFDIGTNIAVPASDRVNLGCSPGDGYETRPYLYVGPWSADRPGDAAYWNAPFGAVLAEGDLSFGSDPVKAGVAFFHEGVSRFSG